MSHNYNTRTKKESVVSSECLQTLEANIINNINSLKDEIISLKDTVIKRLQEENERLCVKCQQLENRVAFIESSHDALEQYGRRNNLVISGIPDSVQDSELESTVTSTLSDIDVNVESKEVEECHRLGKSNNGSILFLLILYLNVAFYIIKFGGKSLLLHWIHIRGLFVI